MTDAEKKEYDDFDPSKKMMITPRVRKIEAGGTDLAGNKIMDVLSFAEEYAIYEIETNDLNKKLRFLTDGWTPERDQNLKDVYIKVKDKYIIAKGLLYRSADSGVMKKRVAEALSTAFCGQPEESLKSFDTLIATIDKEYKSTYKRRLLYTIPSYVLLLLVLLIFHKSWYTENTYYWMQVVLMAIIGGVFSMTFNLRNMRFEEAIGEKIYFMFGLERIFLAILAGVVGVIGIKSKFIFGNLNEGADHIWAELFIIILAGFSESLLPSLLSKYREKV